MSGAAVVQKYAALPATAVYGLSRREAQSSGNVRNISVDLLNPDDVLSKLGQVKDATHLFFGAYVERNTALMMRRLLLTL